MAARLDYKLDFLFVAIAPARLGVNKALVFFDQVKDSFKFYLVVFLCGPMSLDNTSLREPLQDAFSFSDDNFPLDCERCKFVLGCEYLSGG